MGSLSGACAVQHAGHDRDTQSGLSRAEHELAAGERIESVEFGFHRGVDLRVVDVVLIARVLSELLHEDEFTRVDESPDDVAVTAGVIISNRFLSGNHLCLCWATV